jgi:Delta6-protoilludene synthase
MHLFFVYDEYTDVMDVDGAREVARIVGDAFRNPSTPRPPGEHFLGELSRQ